MSDRSQSKWLNAIGAGLIFAGFFLPFIALKILLVSVNVSLSNLAANVQEPLLYLVPIAMVAALVLALLPSNGERQARSYFWGMLICWLVALFGLAFSLLDLYTQVSQGLAFLSSLGGEDLGAITGGLSADDLAALFVNIQPGVGLFFVAIGNLLLLIGLIMRWKEIGTQQPYEPEPWPVAPVVGYQPTELPGQSAISKKTKVPAWLVTKDNRQFQLYKGDTRVGRMSENEIAFNNPRVGRRHAIIRENKGHFYLIDLGSPNGTFINGQRVNGTVLLQADDKITFGGEVKTQFISSSR